MAGLTPEGLSIKTLGEVISDLGETAQEVFADLAPEGEVVNIEENSSLGRIIGVAAPSSADPREDSRPYAPHPNYELSKRKYLAA